MKPWCRNLFTVVSFSCASLIGNAAENPLLSYTHLLPSPFTVPMGRLILGTEIAFGVTDFLQVGSSLIRDVYQIYNANAKLALLDYPEFAAALTLSYETYNLHEIFSANPDVRISSWMPGAVVGYEVLPGLAHFIGGHLAYTDVTVNSEDILTSGYLQGAVGESDISWAYNPKKKSLGPVLAGGITYDFTYKMIGFGVSHYWPGFHLGVHYYPSASDYRLQPILVGGAVVDL